MHPRVRPGARRTRRRFVRGLGGVLSSCRSALGAGTSPRRRPRPPDRGRHRPGRSAPSCHRGRGDRRRPDGRPLRLLGLGPGLGAGPGARRAEPRHARRGALRRRGRPLHLRLEAPGRGPARQEPEVDTPDRGVDGPRLLRPGPRPARGDRRDRLRQGHTPAAVMAYGAPAACAALLPVAPLSGEGLLPTSLQDWAVLAAVALVSQVLGQSLVAYALAGLPAAFSSVALLLQPTIAAALAWARSWAPGRLRTGRLCLPAWCWLGAAADGVRPSGGSEVRKMPEALVSEGFVGGDRAVAPGRITQAERWEAAGSRPGRVRRHRLGLEERHPLADASGGVRLQRGNLLTAAARLARGERIAAPAAGAARSARTSGSHRLVQGVGGLG